MLKNKRTRIKKKERKKENEDRVDNRMGQTRRGNLGIKRDTQGAREEKNEARPQETQSLGQRRKWTKRMQKVTVVQGIMSVNIKVVVIRMSKSVIIRPAAPKPKAGGLCNATYRRGGP